MGYYYPVSFVLSIFLQTKCKSSTFSEERKKMSVLGKNTLKFIKGHAELCYCPINVLLFNFLEYF